MRGLFGNVQHRLGMGCWTEVGLGWHWQQNTKLGRVCEHICGGGVTTIMHSTEVGSAGCWLTIVPGWRVGEFWRATRGTTLKLCFMPSAFLHLVAGKGSMLQTGVRHHTRPKMR